MHSTRRHAALGATLVGACALLVGCGGDSDDGVVRIEGIDIAYDESSYTTETGSVALEFSNEGSLPHNVVFEPAEGAPTAADPDDPTDVVTAGNSVAYDFDVGPGEYAFYCSVPSHREAGMVGTLVVE